MVCIYCGSKTQVINSRPQKRLNHTWRRRECVRCHAVFTTEEAVDYSGSIVVKHPPALGSTSQHSPVQPFSRDKLFASILRAVGHREQPVEDASALTATIIAKLLTQTTAASMAPSDIILVTVSTLQRFDTAACVQYQAYHKG